MNKQQQPSLSSSSAAATTNVVNPDDDGHNDETTTTTTEEDTCFASVQVMDMSQEGKGYGLITTRSIPKGEIIFTEFPKSFRSIQFPKTNSEHMITTTFQEKNNVLACQNCFCSLEPCLPFSKLPWKHLWPIPEYDIVFRQYLGIEDEDTDNPSKEENENEKDSSRTNENNMDTTSNQFLRDKHGRVLCTFCKSLFCSISCKDAFNGVTNTGNNNNNKEEEEEEEVKQETLIVGDWCCCLFRKAKYALLESFSTDYNSTFFDHWPLIIATRIFCSILLEYRNNNHNHNNNSPFPIEDCFFFHKNYCGDSSDISKLELGVPLLQNGGQEDETTRVYKADKTSTPNNISTTAKPYTVQPFYDIVCHELSVTLHEQQQSFVPSLSRNNGNTNEEESIQLLSLDFFGQLTSICKRNVMGLKTKSPFACYEERVVKECRRLHPNNSSCKEKEMKQKIGMAILEYGNDEDIEDMFTVAYGSLLPTVARINHSCIPNATLVDDEYYIQCQVDIVALQNIQRGEEITISYLSTSAGQKDKDERNKRLSSRYLFTCQCYRCSSSQ